PPVAPRLRADHLGVALQVERPALIAVHAVANPLPAFAVTVEVAVLHLDADAVGALGDEGHLHLARLVGIGFELPLRTDVPAEHDPVGRLVGEHSRPAALAA